MTTMETTALMMERLSERELLAVQEYIRGIFAARKVGEEKYNLKPMNREDMRRVLVQAEEDVVAGRGQTWEEVRRDTRVRYGV